MGSRVTGTLPELLEKLAKGDVEDRRSACQSAVEHPSAVLLVDALADALGDGEKAVARAASDALVKIGSQGGAVENAIRKALQSDDPRRRQGAAFTTARLQPPGPRLLPALVEALGSGDGDVRWAAARLIVEIGRAHGEVLPLLLAMLRTGEQAVQRRMATFALRELAPDRAEAAEALLGASRDSDLQVRRAALTAMAALIAPPPDVVSRLLENLREDEDAASRRLAALALGEIGRANREAISPEAIRQLRECAQGAADPDLQRAAERALAGFEPEPGLR
jgi:HEAT repeat protein